jgi:hypothetical protein
MPLFPIRRFSRTAARRTKTPARLLAPLVAALFAAAPAASGAATNSIDTILDDMRLMNDAPLAGVPGSVGWPVGPGQVVMGADPRGTATPWWWAPSNRALKSTAWWNAFVPWLVVFDGVGNGASNTRVEMRGLRAYVRSKRTGRWTEVATGRVDGARFAKHLQGERHGAVDLRTDADGTSSFRPDHSGAFHGWVDGGKFRIDAPDVGAVHVTVEARLAIHDSRRPDDRDRALYLLHVGADYYPDTNVDVSAFAPMGFNPGVGVSRAKRVGTDWQAFSFTTVNVGAVEANGSATSEAELRADPPPMH